MVVYTFFLQGLMDMCLIRNVFLSWLEVLKKAVAFMEMLLTLALQGFSLASVFQTNVSLVFRFLWGMIFYSLKQFSMESQMLYQSIQSIMQWVFLSLVPPILWLPLLSYKFYSQSICPSYAEGSYSLIFLDIYWSRVIPFTNEGWFSQPITYEDLYIQCFPFII